jgi:hypothetical protein
MKTLVDVSQKMPKDLFDALCLYETWCVGKRQPEATEQDVKDWISSRFGEKVANKFLPKYLMA